MNRPGARALCLLLSCIAGAVGCASRQPTPTTPVEPVPKAEPLSKIGNHSPYRVFGQTYRVLPSSRGYREEGLASWYGDAFHGRPTSNQEVFDMHQLTAAHKTLPLPTYARVTNLENGRSVVVRVNDRGPFKGSRIIDLSFAAAQALDMVERGVAPVEVLALVPEEAELDRPLVRSAENLYLQLGAFAERRNAMTLLAKLRAESLPPAQLVSQGGGGKSVHRVRIGPLGSADEADEVTARLLLLGLERPVVVFD